MMDRWILLPNFDWIVKLWRCRMQERAGQVEEAPCVSPFSVSELVTTWKDVQNDCNDGG